MLLMCFVYYVTFGWVMVVMIYWFGSLIICGFGLLRFVYL